MACVFVTGSADGLGRLTAETLLDAGHGVVVHVRNNSRLAAVRDLVDRGAPFVLSNAVDPGWVPTRMGGVGAPDDLRLGHLTQEWLVTSDDPEARTSGGYWHHQRRSEPHPAARDQRFQTQLLDELARLTAMRLE